MVLSCFSCTFCGISLRKYAEPNLSHKSQTTIKFVMKIGASVSETIIFMYLGIAAVSDTRRWNTAFIVLTLVLCLVYRAIGVLCDTAILHKIQSVLFLIILCITMTLYNLNISGLCVTALRQDNAENHNENQSKQ